MTHLEVISLADAKTYLGVDDTSRDVEIQRMIKSTISFVEKRTNHILIEVDKKYNFNQGCVLVYDHPIISTTSTTHESEIKEGYSIYTDDSKTDITLKVGYADLNSVPSDILEACYLMLKFFFFEQEGTGKTPLLVNETINTYKRFII